MLLRFRKGWESCLLWLWPTLRSMVINYLPIICAIIILLFCGSEIKDITARTDIMASIIITSVCLAIHDYKNPKRTKLFDIAKLYAFIGIVLYVILVLDDKLHAALEVRYNWAMYIGVFGTFVSFIILAVTNYDQTASKTQKEATESRSVSQDTIGNKDINV